MANNGVGDGPQYDERNPSCGEEGHFDGCPHQDDLCGNCGDEFGWTYLVGNAVYQCQRALPCGLCGPRLCVSCHEAMHEDNEVAHAPVYRAQQAEREAEREAAILEAGAERVRRLLGLDAEGNG